MDDGDLSVLCEELDPYHDLRRALTTLGFERDEYAGIPVPLVGIPLTVSSKFGFSKAFVEINRITMEKELAANPPNSDDDALKIRNTFFSSKLRCDVQILQDQTGKISYRVRPAANSMSQVIATLFASDVWGVDQEQRALQTLGGMIKHRQFKQYLLTGMFIESSPRSHIPYLFRRLRPTLALAANRPTDNDDKPATMLCGMCMHPIAYYSGSWAGAMCPTDDVIAHLALMRGDEHMFWRRCNQHEPHRPEAGL